MISNERRWPSQRQPQRQPYYQRDDTRPMRPPVQEDTLHTGEMQIERKQFLASLKENPRGRFVRITETASGRSNSIVIPAPGLREFQKLLEDMARAANEIPEKSYPAEPEPEEPDGNRA
ncbi:MAG TPA: RNA-binding protein [Verrucomicrobiae bacterium]|jgi:hypothetical protein|nr:RNA-binding protein [Verrucomicrobiae bacterium]